MYVILDHFLTLPFVKQMVNLKFSKYIKKSLYTIWDFICVSNIIIGCFIEYILMVTSSLHFCAILWPFFCLLCILKSKVIKNLGKTSREVKFIPVYQISWLLDVLLGSNHWCRTQQTAYAIYKYMPINSLCIPSFWKLYKVL